MGTAVVSGRDQFRPKDFRQTRPRPAHLEKAFAGFFGSLEEVNVNLRAGRTWRLISTPGHLR
jgi:hypothetical protein